MAARAVFCWCTHRLAYCPAHGLGSSKAVDVRTYGFVLLRHCNGGYKGRKEVCILRLWLSTGLGGGKMVDSLKTQCRFAYLFRTSSGLKVGCVLIGLLDQGIKHNP